MQNRISSLTKSYYIIFQEISSIHKLVFTEIQQSRDQKGHAYVYHSHPKIIKVVISFPEFVICKTSGYFKDIVDLKILQSDTSRALSLKPNFCQTWNLCRNIANNAHFH